MYTEKDILAMLQSGKSVDEIASEFSSALNAANAAYEEEAARVQKEKEAQEAYEDHLLSLSSLICDFLDEYYHEDVKALENLAGEPLDSKAIADVIETIMDYAAPIVKMAKLVGVTTYDPKSAETAIKSTSAKMSNNSKTYSRSQADESITKFLREIGL